MPEMNRPEFYVGYQPDAPPGVTRVIRVAVAGIAMAALLVAALLIAGQAQFDVSRFEFQQFREYRGNYYAWPYPMIAADGVDYVLAGFGKHGAEVPLGIAEGAAVALRGAKAENGSNRILELMPGTFARIEGAPLARSIARFRTVTLSGEVVDTKCHFGVMNPGRGKVHRDCAARCISGGIPPGLLARDASGTQRVFLLADRNGTLGKALAGFAGEPVSITGEIIRAGSTWVLETSIEAIRRE